MWGPVIVRICSMWTPEQLLVWKKPHANWCYSDCERWQRNWGVFQYLHFSSDWILIRGLRGACVAPLATVSLSVCASGLKQASVACPRCWHTRTYACSQFNEPWPSPSYKRRQLLCFLLTPWCYQSNATLSPSLFLSHTHTHTHTRRDLREREREREEREKSIILENQRRKRNTTANPMRKREKPPLRRCYQWNLRGRRARTEMKADRNRGR